MIEQRGTKELLEKILILEEVRVICSVVQTVALILFVILLAFLNGQKKAKEGFEEEDDKPRWNSDNKALQSSWQDAENYETEKGGWEKATEVRRSWDDPTSVCPRFSIPTSFKCKCNQCWETINC